jgi:hypothetical protein
VGYVVVFTKDTSPSEWSQMGQILVGEEGEELGYSVSTSLVGTRIVAGAPNRGAGSVGSVRVYNFDGQKKQWEMAPIITGSGSGDDTGFSVSMSSTGGRISLGSPFLTRCKYANDACNPGTVQVFEDPVASDSATQPIS